MYIAAAATEIGLLPEQRSSSAALLAMYVAALCTTLGNPRLLQNLDYNKYTQSCTCMSAYVKLLYF